MITAQRARFLVDSIEMYLEDISNSIETAAKDKKRCIRINGDKSTKWLFASPDRLKLVITELENNGFTVVDHAWLGLDVFDIKW